MNRFLPLFCCLLVGVTSTIVFADTNKPVFWVLADSIPDATNQRVGTWKNLASVGGEALAAGDARPTKVAGLNGHAAVQFDGLGNYLECPQLYPIQESYTLFVVLQPTSFSATNNIVSGTTHAFWLGGNIYPRLLHTDFNQQAISSAPLSTTGNVLRLEYDFTTKLAKIYVNNKLGCSTVVPDNEDPTMYLGAFQRGNFFQGAISECRIYSGILEATQCNSIDSSLHAYYNLPRFIPPPPSRVALQNFPTTLQTLPRNVQATYPVSFSGRLLNGTEKAIELLIDSNKRLIKKIETEIVNAEFEFATVITNPGLTFYTFTIRVQDSLHNYDTVAIADSVQYGYAIAISGQSNSIFGASGLPANPYARTFGINASASDADTLFTYGTAEGYGGGPHVGAWGYMLQKYLADDYQLPSCVINGGVGGTAIEYHVPDTNNRYNRNTIYGSWLYRIQKSGLQNAVEDLFWYQGESNNNQDYAEQFNILYKAWKQDLPSLKRIYVVQIHPGCGGPTNHAFIRNQQRVFSRTYSDITVVSATNLPEHDGCHFGKNGYTALSENLQRILYNRAFNKGYTLDIYPPNLREALYNTNVPHTVRLIFDNAPQGLSATPDVVVEGKRRSIKDAFVVNGQNGVVTDVAFEGNNVVLRLLGNIIPDSIQYIPDMYYEGTQIIYNGPWLVGSSNLAALTFRTDVTTATGIIEEYDEKKHAPTVWNWYTILGEYVFTGTTLTQRAVPVGAYFLVNPTSNAIVKHIVLP